MKLELSIKKQLILPLSITGVVLSGYLVFGQANYYLIMLTYSLIALVLTYFYYRNEIPAFYTSFLKAMKIRK